MAIRTPMQEPANDTSQLADWVDAYGERLCRAAAFLANPREAEDLCQEVFLIAARRIVDFEGRSAPYTWLYGILRNVVRDHQRRLLRRSGGVPGRSPSALRPGEVVQRDEDRKILRNAVQALPESQRAVVWAYYLEEKSVSEIADILNVPVGTVKSRLYSGREALKRSLRRGGDVGAS